MRIPLLVFLILSALSANRADAWGELGHRVTALIAYRHLTPVARVKLDALLASDTDPLTPPDFGSRAYWADKYRQSHRETAAWHYINIEIDAPDLDAACNGFPALTANQEASQGPAQDCIVNKLEEFAAELRSPATPPPERLLALKFLIHFVGDLHQPLHAADHDDRGGNCIELAPAPDLHETNLHAYWDVGVINAGGRSAETLAAELDAGITPAQMQAWTEGSPRSWALESFEVGKRDVYALPSRPTCHSAGTVALSADYQTAAQKDAALQLRKAGIRLAAMLNTALGG